MKLSCILFATLVKSISASFSVVGAGECVDSAGNLYNSVESSAGQANNIYTAYDWCLTATAYSSSLVGVEIIHASGIWVCDYDNNGSIDQIKLTDFTPAASNVNNGGIGSGAVKNTDGDGNYNCWSNDVRPNDSKSMISFLKSSHGSWLPPILLYCIRTL
jgi:hypothetical protein